DRHLRVVDFFERGDDLLFHSVVTVSAELLVSADFNVCQARVAHLTRAGYSRTPPKTRSFPRSLVAGTSVVSRSWKRSIVCRASSRVLPFRVSVISEADAVEIAQPDPTKLMSRTTSPSSLRYSFSLSPQSGL